MSVQVCYALSVVCDFCRKVRSLHPRLEEDEVENDSHASARHSAAKSGFRDIAGKDACGACSERIRETFK